MAVGHAYQLTLGSVFQKLALRHLHSALCHWHKASYDPFMLHCIAIFVVNSLDRALGLQRPAIPSRTLNRKYGRLHLLKTRPGDRTRRPGPSPGGIGWKGCHPAGPCTELWRRYGAPEFR
jgi:hypothetical protein